MAPIFIEQYDYSVQFPHIQRGSLLRFLWVTLKEI
jgi:hypothetical protein